MSWNSGPMLSDRPCGCEWRCCPHCAHWPAPHPRYIGSREFVEDMKRAGQQRAREVPPDPHAGHDTCPHCHRCRDCGGSHRIDCPSR